jgi:signal transduction histidine kinase
MEAQFLRSQRLESLGTLVSGIAHDLNNILTPILLVVQRLPLKLGNLDPWVDNKLKILETSAQRGADMVTQILIVARGLEGKRTDLRVNHLLLDIRKLVQQTLPKSIDIDLAETALADPHGFQGFLAKPFTHQDLQQQLQTLALKSSGPLPRGVLRLPQAGSKRLDIDRDRPVILRKATGWGVAKR